MCGYELTEMADDSGKGPAVSTYIAQYSTSKLINHTQSKAAVNDSSNLPLLSSSPLRPKPWQLVFAALAQNEERTPLKGGINADGCGLGKINNPLQPIALEEAGLPFEVDDMIVDAQKLQLMTGFVNIVRFKDH